MTITANVAAPKLATGQAQKEQDINEASDRFDALTGGYLTKSVAGGSNIVLTTAEACNAVMEFTGVLTGNINVALPSGSSNGRARRFTVVNSTTGAFTLTVIYQGGSGVAVPQGYRQALMHNGTNVLADGDPISATSGAATAARVHNNANISVPNATVTALTFNAERRDDGGLHDTGSNTDRLTAPVAGWYHIWGNVEFASNATGYRSVSIRLGATPTVIAARAINAVSGDTTVMDISTIYYLAAGDYVKLGAYQNSGGALNALSTGQYSPEFSMVRVG